MYRVAQNYLTTPWKKLFCGPSAVRIFSHGTKWIFIPKRGEIILRHLVAITNFKTTNYYSFLQNQLFTQQFIPKWESKKRLD
jgi:hypothetical protein